MKYRINVKQKLEWQTSTVVFMGIIIVALGVSLFLSMWSNLRDPPLVSCRDYQYDVYGRKVCLILETELVK